MGSLFSSHKLRLFTGCVLFLSLFCSPEAEKATEKEKLPATSTTLADNLKVRISPNVMGAEMGSLDSGTEVKLLDRSAGQVRIGRMNAHWYKVESDEGLKGWVYGAYLTVEADPNLAVDNARRIEKMKESIVGRWYASRQSGSLLDMFVSVYPDGVIAFGSAGREIQKGKFTVEESGSTIDLTVEDIKNPMFSLLNAELRGETLIFKGTHRETEYKLQLSDRDPSAGLNKGAAKPDATAPEKKN